MLPLLSLFSVLSFKDLKHCFILAHYYLYCVEMDLLLSNAKSNTAF